MKIANSIRATGSAAYAAQEFPPSSEKYNGAMLSSLGAILEFQLKAAIAISFVLLVFKVIAGSGSPATSALEDSGIIFIRK